MISRPGRAVEAFIATLWFVGWCGAAWALEPHECLVFDVAPTGAAAYTNQCSDVINMMYCVDHADSEKSCARAAIPVVTFHHGVREVIEGYVAQGKPPIHAAICVYPQAPVGWKPEANASYVCKKTCVMC